MVKGRLLYREVAFAALSNARQLFGNAERLRSARSRGHACSLFILALEESSKAIIYFLAAEGVIRIVKKKPNNITTFKKEDLRRHPFKHQLIANYLIDYLAYAPFYAVISEIQNGKLNKKEVELILLKAIYAHRQMQFDLREGSANQKKMEELFQLFERLDSFKNRGLYVDHSNDTVLLPADISMKDLKKVHDLSKFAIEIAMEFLKEKLDPEMRQMHVQEMRAFAARTRKSRKKTTSQ